MMIPRFLFDGIGARYYPPLVVAALLISQAPGEVSLQNWTLEEGREVVARLEWKPRPLPPLGEDGFLRARAGEPFSEYGNTAAQWQAESVFLALPPTLSQNLDTAEWAVSAADGAHESVPFELKAATAGTLHGLQVLIQPSGYSEDSIVIELRGPVAPKGSAPKQARKPVPPEVRGLALNEDSITWDTSAPGRSKSGLPLPEPPGTWRVSYANGNEVLKVPFSSVQNAPVGQIRIDWHGETLPIIGSDATHFWFYAPRRNTYFDTRDCVMLSTSTLSASPMVTTRPAFQTLTSTGAEVPSLRRARFEQAGRMEARREDRPPGDRFVWYRVQNPVSVAQQIFETKQVTLTLYDKLASSDVSLHVELWGATSPPHQADFLLNGETVGLTQWEGFGTHLYSTTKSMTNLSPTSWTFRHTIPTPLELIDQQALDNIQLEYSGYLFSNANRKLNFELRQTPDGLPRRVSVGGFASSITASTMIVLDVTAPAAPVMLSAPSLLFDSKGTRGVQFEMPGTESKVHVQQVSVIAAPTSIIEAQRLPDTSSMTATIKGVVVRPEIFASTVAPLMTARGEGYVELNPQAAYDVYNGGQESPFAIRDAIEDLFTHAPQRVSFPSILLVGTGPMDARNYYGLHTGAEVLSFPGEGPWANVGRIELSDDWSYGLLFGDDLMMDASVGRIPAKNSTDLAKAVTRIVAYDAAEESLIDKDRVGVFVMDNDLDFAADTPLWGTYYAQTGKPTQTLSLANMSIASMKAALKNVMEDPNAGAGIIFYVGHGASNTWAGEQIFTSANAGENATDGRWPIVFSSTCLNHYYSFPGTPFVSLGEAWLFAASNRGAVASWATSVNDYYAAQRPLAIEIMQGYAMQPPQRPLTIGRLTASAMNRYLTEYPGLTVTAKGYCLFGDPETGLAINPPNASVPGWVLFYD